MTDHVEANMEKFRAYLASQGLRLTDQREAITRVFFCSDKHMSLIEILELAQARRKGIGYATVYRTMRLLADAGFADEHRFGEDQTRYEVKHEEGHHDHLICVECGMIVEFEDDTIEKIQEQIALDHGFQVVSHRHEVYVKCLANARLPNGRRADCPGATGAS